MVCESDLTRFLVPGKIELLALESDEAEDSLKNPSVWVAADDLSFSRVTFITEVKKIGIDNGI
jgi:hypothetical protein